MTWALVGGLLAWILALLRVIRLQQVAATRAALTLALKDSTIAAQRDSIEQLQTILRQDAHRQAQIEMQAFVHRQASTLWMH